MQLNRRHLTPDEHTQLNMLTNGVYQPGRTPDTLGELLSAIPEIKPKTYVPKPPIQATRDTELVALFKPTPKMYFSHRRLKMSSLLKYTGVKLASDLTGLSYQLALNILIWAQCLGQDEISMLLATNIFDSDEDFTAIAKSISLYLKPYGQFSRIKHLFCELETLVGYLYEDENWDLDTEISKLAGCKPQRIKDWNEHWVEALNEVVEYPTHLPRQVPFEEYVKSLSWTTTGSSSIGKILYTDHRGKCMHFKPRKNMVTAIMTPDQIWDIVRVWDGKITNIPVIKNELGKIRLAIASNFESYIFEAYCLDMFGHSFKNWGGITLDESVTEEIDRTSDDMAALENGGYALPWDFAQFDHQVRTEEITDILGKMRSYAHPDTHPIWDKVIGSYHQATIRNPATGSAFNITAGLQSGQRTTSLIGNVWNAIVTRAAVNRVTRVLGYAPRYRIGIRGDDTYIIAHTPVELYFMRLAYASFLIVGHDRKFSIRPNSFEFLRNTTYGDRVVGWTPRAIPAITQRKPWSDDLLTPHLEVVTIAENIRNMERRSSTPLPLVHSANKFQWSKFTKQSYLWLELPRRSGGLGVYPFRGFLPDGKLSLTPEVNTATDTIFSTYAPPFLNLSPDEAQSYNRSRFKSMVKPGDMRHLLSSILTSFRDKVKLMGKITWKRTPFPVIIPTTTDTPPLKYKFKKGLNLTPVNPAWPRFDEFLSIYPHWRAAKKTVGTLASIMAKEYPKLYNWMKIYERLGYHRSDAIGLILGDQPLETVWPLNQKTKDCVTSHLLGPWEWPPIAFRERKKIGSYIYQLTRTAVDLFSHTSLARKFLY